jgi:Xaa-Pro aminopeptidase
MQGWQHQIQGDGMFQREEIDGKKKQLRLLMTELGLTGILLRKQCNFSWLTAGGLNVVGIATEMGVASLLITADREYVLCNNIEAPRMEREELLTQQGYELKVYPWHDDQERRIVAEMAAGGEVGCDSAFPGTRDIAARINALRYSLTAPEVARYKELGALTSRAIEEAAMTIEPGDKECAVIGRLAERLWQNRLDYITTFCAADERIASFRHPIATEARIEKRAMLCVNARKWGLIVSLTRFVQFGPIPDDISKKYAANVYIDCVMMANSIPGKPAVEAFQKGLEAYKETGYADEWQLHHQGGSIGYVGRDYKVDFRTTEVVRENQGFAWNPSITGTKSEDTMLATSAGPVLLSPPVLFPTMTVQAGGHNFVRPAILQK